MNNRIAIDFVAGTHGHFLETTLNKFFNITPELDDAFTTGGTSHHKSEKYNNNKLFHADHWYELYPDQLNNFKKIISIRFTANDLLLVSSVSLLRAGDFNIENNELEINTVNKLNNQYYQSVLAQVYTAYPTLDLSLPNIPRNVLREFFKFGFKDTNLNGYWLKQQSMQYPNNGEVCYFEFNSFYNIDSFIANINRIERMINIRFDFSDKFYQHHNKFLSFIPYIGHKEQCDYIIDCIVKDIDLIIPPLTLLQESYINGNLENICNKEMPFHQNIYFTSTKDMLYYINNDAPNL